MSHHELTQWLLQQIAEDIAPAAVPTWHKHYCIDRTDVYDGRCGYCGATEDTTKVEYVDRHPRVLAEGEAKRKIISLHVPARTYSGRTMQYCNTCGSGEPYEYPHQWPCDTLNAYVELYVAVGRTGCREEWRPSTGS